MNLSKILELVILARENNNKSLELEEMIKKEMLLEETMKKGGNTAKSRLKSAQKYINKNIKNINARTFTHGVSYQDGYQCFTNGYTAIRTKNFIQGVEEVEEPINFSSLFIPYKNSNSDYTIIKEKIDIKQLKCQLKEIRVEERLGKKTTKNFVSDKREIQIGKNWFNIELWVEILEICNHSQEHTIYQHKDVIGPTIIEMGEDNALILPIRRIE